MLDNSINEIILFTTCQLHNYIIDYFIRILIWFICVFIRIIEPLWDCLLKICIAFIRMWLWFDLILNLLSFIKYLVLNRLLIFRGRFIRFWRIFLYLLLFWLSYYVNRFFINWNFLWLLNSYSLWRWRRISSSCCHWHRRRYRYPRLNNLC
jgi:hypothetical protein